MSIPAMTPEQFNKIEGVQFPFQTKFNHPIDFTKFINRPIACPNCYKTMVFNKYTIGEFEDFYIINCYGLCPSCNQVSALPQLKFTGTKGYVFIKEKNAWLTSTELRKLRDEHTCKECMYKKVAIVAIVTLILRLLILLFL